LALILLRAESLTKNTTVQKESHINDIKRIITFKIPENLTSLKSLAVYANKTFLEIEMSIQ